jgi:hypothetical protein
LGRYGYDDITNKDIKRAKATSFRQTVRIFRGTDGKHPGVVYTKDLAYFNGQQKAWSILKDVRNPSDLDFILSGKLDLTNEFHRKIAEEIVQKTA